MALEEPAGMGQSPRAIVVAAVDPEGAARPVLVRDAVREGVPALVPWDALRRDEVRLGLVAAQADELAPCVREVAIGGPQTNRRLDLVEVHGVALPEGLLAARHRKPEPPGRIYRAGGHCGCEGSRLLLESVLEDSIMRLVKAALKRFPTAVRHT